MPLTGTREPDPFCDSGEFNISDVDSEVECAAQLLRLLDFPGMTSRKDTVAAANVKTFPWVFQPNTKAENCADVSHWLLRGDRFYWVTGKAGSGKSTLMNFLLTSPETEAALSKWAGNAGVVLVSYFFWNSGRSLQKSILGLLRASVYQILENDRSMARIVERVLFESRCSSTGCPPFRETVLSESKLCEVLLALLDHGKSQSSSYCFFIDALGECEGDRTVLLSLLEKLVERPHVKVCASSTPWPSLRRFFRLSATLTLENFTSADLLLYAGERMRQQLARTKQAIAESNVEKLASEIVARSNGIFLWVVLVTCEMNEGLARGDSIDVLLRRLDASPPEIRDLLPVILDRRADALFRDSAMRYLSLRAASSEPVDLLTFSMACLENSHAAERDQLMSISMDDAQPMVQEIAETLSARTAGLLEVSCDPIQSGYEVKHPIFLLMAYDVSFLHDSVTTVVKDSPAQKVAYLHCLLQASVRVGTWLRHHEQGRTLSARAYRQAVQFAKSIDAGA